MAAITNPLMGRSRRQQGKRLGREEDIGFENRRIVGDYVAELRRKRGLTQLEVAKSMGMRDAAVSAIELGRNSLPPERMAPWADILGVDRRQFAKHITRYYNPWLFSMLFPKEMPEEALEGLPERLVDHRK
jgi:transcriptional regulator with XRE-family HTH domain